MERGDGVPINFVALRIWCALFAFRFGTHNVEIVSTFRWVLWEDAPFYCSRGLWGVRAAEESVVINSLVKVELLLYAVMVSWRFNWWHDTSVLQLIQDFIERQRFRLLGRRFGRLLPVCGGAFSIDFRRCYFHRFESSLWLPLDLSSDFNIDKLQRFINFALHLDLRFIGSACLQ